MFHVEVNLISSSTVSVNKFEAVIELELHFSAVSLLFRTFFACHRLAHSLFAANERDLLTLKTFFSRLSFLKNKSFLQSIGNFSINPKRNFLFFVTQRTVTRETNTRGENANRFNGRQICDLGLGTPNWVIRLCLTFIWSVAGAAQLSLIKSNCWRFESAVAAGSDRKSSVWWKKAPNCKLMVVGAS